MSDSNTNSPRMSLVTKRLLIQMLPERWHHTYPDGKFRPETYSKIISLKNPTEDEIAALIGNRSWTSLVCNSCRKEVDEVVSMDVTSGEYATYMCRDCLQKALDLLKGSQ